MTWKVEWHPQAFRFLEHYEGYAYKLRIGDYRALVDLEHATGTMLVMHFDHRKRVYK